METPLHRLSNRDPKKLTGTCSVCGPVKIRFNGAGRYACAVRRDKSQRLAAYRRRLGRPITYQDIPDSCEVCGGKTRIAADHDHVTGKFRGWLCMQCNTALGSLKDDPSRLRALISYLERHADPGAPSDLQVMGQVTASVRSSRLRAA